MANRHQNSNREKRKPKATKPKVPLQASSFTRPAVGTLPKSDGSKKAK